MLWKDEVAKRGIIWAAIWDNERLRQITSSLRAVVWYILHPDIHIKNTRNETNFSDLVRRQATPPRLPMVKQPPSSIFRFFTFPLPVWKN